MSQYKILDDMILSFIHHNDGVFFSAIRYSKKISGESKRLADFTGRESFRIIDGRLQYLRKQKQITYKSKTGGWHVVRYKCE